MAIHDVYVARAAMVKIAQILSQQKIAVTQRGAQALCEADEDGRPIRINLPATPNDASEQVLRAAQGFLDHEVGHVLFTDFKSVRVAANESELLKHLHNIVEDVVIERRIAARFRGAEYNLEQTRRFVLDEHTEPALLEMTARKAPESELFALLCMPMARAWGGQTAMIEYMADKWTLVPAHAALLKDLVERFPLVEDSWSALELAREIERRLAQDAPETHDLLSEYACNAEAALKLEYDEFENAAPSGPGATFDRALARALSRRFEAESANGEWRPFTTDFDRVAPLEIDGADWSGPLARMRAETEAVIGPLARVIERLTAARRRAHWVGGKRRGRLHSAALHRAPLGDPRLFRMREIHEARDAAISLLVDLSGSMAGRRVWIACTSSLAMSEMLTRAGVAHEALGFSTLDADASFDEPANEEYRRHRARLRKKRPVSRESRAWRSVRRGHDPTYSRFEPLHVPILKGFDETLNTATRPRFALAATCDKLMRNNIDHESVHIAGARLMKRPEPRKALIVFSDGEPAFDGDVDASRRLLKAEVAMLERAGALVYGVGVESEVVKDYYPRHEVIEHVASLPEALTRLVRSALL